MKKLFISLLLLTSCTLFAQKYKPTWESLAKYKETPEWFKDAKFGIYLHWGVYSVPEYSTEWYPRYVYFKWHEISKFHENTYGKKDYHELVPLFTAENFDAPEWADLFKKAGARFAGLVTEHHDGFSMWNSECTPWNVADMGPHKDIVGLLEKSIKGEGMKFITTFHHARNFQRYSDPKIMNEELTKDYSGHEHHRFYQSHFPYYPNTAPSSNDKKLQLMYGNMPAKKWYEEVWLAKLEEVIDKYDPDIIYFDSWLDLIPEEYRQKFCAYYLNKADERRKDVLILRKQNDLPLSVSVENLEHSRKNELQPVTWQTEQTISYDSWSYTKDFKIKPASHLVHEMIDIVSKNGIFLLNISPKANGIIPDDQRKVLLEIGAWLEKYGEAIYGTRPWYTFGEGPTKQPVGGMEHRAEFDKVEYTYNDFRFTTKGNSVYILVLGEPQPGTALKINAFAKSKLPGKKRISKVSMLGTSAQVNWAHTDDGLQLSVPNTEYNISTVYKVDF